MECVIDLLIDGAFAAVAFVIDRFFFLALFIINKTELKMNESVTFFNSTRNLGWTRIPADWPMSHRQTETNKFGLVSVGFDFDNLLVLVALGWVVRMNHHSTEWGRVMRLLLAFEVIKQ